MRGVAIAVVTVAALLPGCGDTTVDTDGTIPPTACSAGNATATTAVSLAAMQFIPYCVRVSPGASVTFTNADFIDHTATADAAQPEPFESGLLQPGHQFTHTFSATPKTVRVHCRLHPEMSGMIIVQ